MNEKTKILLVDDEEEFVEALAQRLEIRNCEVLKAFSGQAALQSLENNAVDVIILDVLMPGMDGIETLKEIKNKYPLIEVIMLTGHATVQTAIDGMKLGAYDYMMKPTDTEILAEKIKSAHDRKKEHEQRIQQAEIDNIIKRRGW